MSISAETPAVFFGGRDDGRVFNEPTHGNRIMTGDPTGSYVRTSRDDSKGHVIWQWVQNDKEASC